MRKLSWTFFSLLVFGCSSAPVKTGPDWIRLPSRTVDNGYIVYIGTMGGPNPEKAQFKAEGQALEDLANECSVIPMGTRIEDRYIEQEKYGSTAYVKIGVEFQLCEQAKKTREPEEIRKIASVPFAQQLKRYQDLVETGEMADPSEVATIEPPTEVQPLPQSANWNSTTHYFVVRQYIAYQKEVVVLAPPTAYAPASKESQAFAATMAPSTQKLAQLEESQPQLRTTPGTWSKLADRPKLERPGTLVRRINVVRPLRAAPQPRQPRAAAQPKRGRGFRRGRHEREESK